MEYLHTMVRVADLDAALDFYCTKLGLVQIARDDYEQGRFSLIFLAAPGDAERAEAKKTPTLELTYNWDPESSPDGVSIELLQKGEALAPAAPWKDMENVGEW